METQTPDPQTIEGATGLLSILDKVSKAINAILNGTPEPINLTDREIERLEEMPHEKETVSTAIEGALERNDPVSDFIAIGVINVTTTPTRAIGQNDSRLRVLISNRHASEDIFVGSNEAVTTADGFQVKFGESLEIETRDDLYLVAAATNNAVQLLQEYRS